jgi:hypothetical protein
MRKPQRRKSKQPYKQGYFRPKNKDKCINKEDVVFRSMLEAKFMTYCDSNANVIKWSSERVIIPYFNPIENKQRRYFIDFYVQMKTSTGIIDLLVEVKPKRQLQKPKESSNKKPSTIIYENKMWIVNNAKWDAAEKYAEKKGMTFKKITEDDINELLG